jgi:hypothetical protein
MTVILISICAYYMLFQFHNMTSLPYLYIPCVSTANPQLSLDYHQDNYKPIFNCKGTTLTLITRNLPTPTKFMELSHSHVKLNPQYATTEHVAGDNCRGWQAFAIALGHTERWQIVAP